jgi:hypothetical protein
MKKYNLNLFTNHLLTKLVQPVAIKFEIFNIKFRTVFSFFSETRKDSLYDIFGLCRQHKYVQ